VDSSPDSPIFGLHKKAILLHSSDKIKIFSIITTTFWPQAGFYQLCQTPMTFGARTNMTSSLTKQQEVENRKMKKNDLELGTKMTEVQDSGSESKSNISKDKIRGLTKQHEVEKKMTWSSGAKTTVDLDP